MPTAVKLLSPLDYLFECFDPEYEAEVNERLLTWRWRPMHHFPDGGHSSEHTALAWNTKFAGQPAGAPCPNGRYLVRLNGGSYWRYRILWKMYHKEEPPAKLDHINTIKSDDRISN